MAGQAKLKLFAGLQFLVALKVPDRVKLLRDLKDHDGGIAPIESRADYCLVDPRASNVSASPKALSYEFVPDSIQHGRLQDPAAYRLHHQPRADRPVGGVAASVKTTRTPFTREDDQLLYNWLTPFRENGGKWKGNQIFAQLAQCHPHHTMQSWRARYTNYYVGDMPGFSITAEIDPHPPTHTDEAVEGRPPKRRRLDGHQPSAHQLGSSKPGLEYTSQARSAEVESPVQPKRHSPDKDAGQHQMANESCHRSRKEALEVYPPADSGLSPKRPYIPRQFTQNNTFHTAAKKAVSEEDENVEPDDVDVDPRSRHRQELLPRSYTRRMAGHHDFSLDEARHLYRAVPNIWNTSPEMIKSCWASMANHWEGHTPDEWQYFFETAILPEYRRRNRLATDTDFNDYVLAVLRKEEAFSTPEIKREPTPDLRTPRHKQRGREADRARAETGDMEMSEPSDDERSLKSRHSPHPPSPSKEPRSPATQRVSVLANEGRKRASQNSNSTHTTSQPSQEMIPPSTVSPKKKLFGQVLDLSPSTSQYNPPPRAYASSPTAENTSAQSLTLEADERPHPTLSSSSFPAAEGLPESYQLPPKSAPTSQESAAYDTAKQIPPTSARAHQEVSKASVPTVKLVKQERQAKSPLIDLLDDGEDHEVDDLQSQGVLSDTGSEYQAFETAPERSRLWETGSSDEQSEDDDDGDDDNGTAEFMAKEAQRRPPTPLRSRTNVDQVTDDEDEEAPTEPMAAIVQSEKVVENRSKKGRLETQALFERPAAEEQVSEFDLPPPEGGWEALGLDTAEEEDPDTPLETIELLGGHALEQRVSPEPSEATLESSAADEIQTKSAAVFATRHSRSISSDEPQSENDEQPQLSTGPASKALLVQPRPLSHADLMATERTTSSSSPSPSPDEPLIFATRHELESWQAAQLQRYQHLPKAVCKRLANTALQSTCNNLSTSGFVLRDLVTTFRESERARELKFRRHAKPFIPKQSVTEERAKAMLPENELGVWTPDDDQALMSRTPDSLRRVEVKHTKSRVQDRTAFLRKRYQLL